MKEVSRSVSATAGRPAQGALVSGVRTRYRWSGAGTDGFDWISRLVKEYRPADGTFQ
jgi:hypothetical protein